MSQETIQWVFNPPAMPHMGGVWERLVRSCNKALSVVLQNRVLTDEVLVAASANSCLLTEVSWDMDDLKALTQNHFLIGRESLNLTPGIVDGKELPSRKRWQQVEVKRVPTWFDYC